MSNNDTSSVAWEALIDDLPVSLIVYRTDGTISAMNRKAEELWSADRSALIGKFNILEDPQSIALGTSALFAHALTGATFETEPAPYDTRQVQLERRADRRMWIQATFFPLRSADGQITSVGILHRDITAAIEQSQAIERAQREIDAQRDMIQTLSTPVVQVWDGILLVPLVGRVDARRATIITEELLMAITSHAADVVILDITGVPVVDTGIASYLLTAARATRLLGCEIALVGIKSEIAQTIVQLGADLSYLTTLADLKAGIAWAFKRRGLRVVQGA